MPSSSYTVLASGWNLEDGRALVGFRTGVEADTPDAAKVGELFRLYKQWPGYRWQVWLATEVLLPGGDHVVDDSGRDLQVGCLAGTR
jgi:hypothetical protein